MKSLLVTIPAGGSTAATTQDLYASTMILKASGTDYMGGSDVSSTKGVPVGTTTPTTVVCATPRGMSLKNLYFSGTNGDTIIIVYEPSA